MLLGSSISRLRGVAIPSAAAALMALLLLRVVANDALGIDGVSETDGLEVSSAALGAQFPDGLLVAQDGRNITPAQRQNFKFVSWAKIAAALGL